MITKNSNGNVEVWTAEGADGPGQDFLDYRRGVRHGLQAAASVAAWYDKGRSWTSGHVAEMIDDLANDIGKTCARIGEVLDDQDDIPLSVDIGDVVFVAGLAGRAESETRLPRPKPKRATIKAKKKTKKKRINPHAVTSMD